MIDGSGEADFFKNEKYRVCFGNYLVRIYKIGLGKLRLYYEVIDLGICIEF